VKPRKPHAEGGARRPPPEPHDRAASGGGSAHRSEAHAKTDLLPRLARRVRGLRAERGLSAKALAEGAGLSLRFVSALEGGAANISVLNLEAVARALGTTLPALLADAPAPAAADPAGRVAALLAGRTPEEAARCLEAVEQTLGARPRRAIALLGLRGAGKSTIGRALGDALGLPFVELDDRIEAAAGLSLAELFAIHGEGYYRRLEARVLGELLAEGARVVVALGGGVVLNEPAFTLARTRCTTVWLRASPADHMGRVLAQGDRRPVKDREDAMTELEAILAAREPYYRQADVTIDTSHHGTHSLPALVKALERAGWSG
jgi:XRE family aerobic/anaerobic benzoate catabolism transcriptional regulator